jgi:hypothetical protein
VALCAAGARGAGRECKPWVSVDVDERPGAAASTLALMLESAGEYSCLGYRIPARLERAGRELVVHLGDVQPPKGPCATALGPAAGGLTLPPLAVGEHVLVLEHHGRRDRWRVLVEADALTFAPLDACFSSSVSSTRPRRRAPAGAFGVACFEIRGGTCAGPDAGAVACAQVFREPPLEGLARVAPAEGGFATRAFGAAAAVFVGGDVEAVQRVLGERYPPGRSCLTVNVSAVARGARSR